jgi:hypothetical protein
LQKIISFHQHLVDDFEVEQPMKKRCKQCGEEKLAEDFYRAKDGVMGRRPECKRCSNAYHNEWARMRYQPLTRGRYQKAA